ncbi:olfactory receptor 1468-like [Bombina bombina]|uniref:olfactory receptor 1468-like n=1 Tax=Bombina bombina TaxID=8345 RepID=UPI00235A7DD5|nr:olfactory receptor 1468-like [Bombina bombina]
MALFSTDAEKAFDQVDWSFLRQVMRTMNFGEPFLNMVFALYSSPNARIRINGTLSNTFTISNGTRQGCPLSPLLFALSIEALAQKVRLNSNITGIRIGDMEYKQALYADDVLYTLTNVETSIPELLREIQEYGEMSNFHLNLSKSELLNINTPVEQIRLLATDYNVPLAASKLKYLGIYLSANPSDLYKHNYLALRREIINDLSSWRNKSLSWLGKISLIKMNILPRILFGEEENQTSVITFILLGFQELHIINHFLFVLALTVYILTLLGNLLIVILVSTSSLEAPMYIFLGQLSLADILLTTNIVPNMLHTINRKHSTISVTGCFIQIYVYGFSAATECYLLTAMSYDRYLAICQPLQYTSLMDLALCKMLVLLSWIVGSLSQLIPVILISNLNFCGPNVIDHFFCDLAPLLNLSCSDTSVLELEVFMSCLPILLFPFIFIIVSYAYISLAIHRISSTIGRQKALSTCSSHLTVVCTYYGTLMTKYMAPSKGHSLIINKVLSLLYIVGTPLCNPLIYSLRNKEIRLALLKHINLIK